MGNPSGGWCGARWYFQSHVSRAAASAYGLKAMRSMGAMRSTPGSSQAFMV
jgi:hypothetical protein